MPEFGCVDNRNYWAERGQGMLEISIDRHDRRRRTVRLTNKGRFFVHTLEEALT